MKGSRLLEYFLKYGPSRRVVFPNGAVMDAKEFPVAAVETTGAILFADLPNFSQTAARLSPAETACYVSHFFAWLEGSAGRRYGGIVDKFIGDEVMMVFLPSQCRLPPLEAALRTAYDMLECDWFGFDAKFGVAAGPFAVALVGTEEESAASAMGHTVNVAARCIQGATSAKSVTVSTTDSALMRKVFAGSAWELLALRALHAKHMEPVPVLEVVRRETRFQSFDYEALVKKRVRYARDNGAIVSDPPGAAAGPDPAADALLAPAGMPRLEAPRLMLPVLQAGAARCAERLSRICRQAWSVEALALDAQALGGFAALLDGISDDHYGSYCSLPGAAFLVVFDRQSGLRVCGRFIGDFSDRVEAVEHLEAKTLAEVSNILVNALSDGLSAGDPDAHIISAPAPLLESTRELLQTAFKKFKTYETVAMTCHARLTCPSLDSQATLVILLAPGIVERVVLASAENLQPQAGLDAKDRCP